MKGIILLCMFSLAACSYQRAEHYPSTQTVARLVVTQKLDASGRPDMDTSELSLKARSVYADLWIYDSAAGEHALTCRLYSLHGQLRDEQELPAVNQGHTALHRTCSFTLETYDPVGVWSLQVLMDGQPLTQRRLAVGP